MQRARLEWDLPGLIVPALTPFDARGKVEFSTLERQIDYIIDRARPAAICVVGVEAQEYQYLTDAQRREVIEKTASFVRGRVPMVVGVSAASYRHSLELAELAEKLGADAVQVLLPNRPSGGAPTTAELVEYFELIARESPLRLFAYVNPGSGMEPSLAQLTEILKLDRVVGVKESSRNQRYLGLLIADVEVTGYAHVFTTMEVMLPTLQLGGSGAEMPAPGAMLCAIMLDAFRGNDVETATRIHRIVAEFPARWLHHGGMVGVMKAALRAVGLDCGECYPPFGRLSMSDVAAIELVCDEIDRAFPGAMRYRPAAAKSSERGPHDNH